MKLHIHMDDNDISSVKYMTEQYRLACNFVSQYIFDHNFPMSSVTLSNRLYQTIRSEFGLKSQMTQSAIRTVTARYDGIRTQMKEKPYKFKDVYTNRWHCVYRTLDWLQKPVLFSRPQVDLVRNRDYSIVTDQKTNTTYLSLNTLDGRIKVTFDVPACFSDYFDGTWSFGTGKIVSLKDEWYFHIPMTRKNDTEFDQPPAKNDRHTICTTSATLKYFNLCFNLTSMSLKQIILYNLLLIFLCKAFRRYSKKRNVSSDVHSSSFYSIVICVCFSSG